MKNKKMLEINKPTTIFNCEMSVNNSNRLILSAMLGLNKIPCE